MTMTRIRARISGLKLKLLVGLVPTTLLGGIALAGSATPGAPADVPSDAAVASIVEQGLTLSRAAFDLPDYAGGPVSAAAVAAAESAGPQRLAQALTGDLLALDTRNVTEYFDRKRAAGASSQAVFTHSGVTNVMLDGSPVVDAKGHLIVKGTFDFWATYIETLPDGSSRTGNPHAKYRFTVGLRQQADGRWLIDAMDQTLRE